ncbi:Swainsonine transporter swnT [Paramyrothecium foliicola]|nr:Swainsonine transporter swnT [Paramyrothecium foliicola]
MMANQFSKQDLAPPSARPKRSFMASEKPDMQVPESGSMTEGDVTIQKLKPFRTLSAIGIGYGVTNTAIGLLLTLGTVLPLGGSPLFFWGFLVMAAVGLATATTLAELASAMPHPGGQYVWVNRLAPARYRRFLSYATAMFSWLGAVATGASVCLSVPVGVCGIISLFNPNFEYKKWMGFVGYQLLNIITVFLASFERALPRISNVMLLFSCLMTGIVSITLFAMSSTKVSTKDFFITKVNISGWPDGIAFIMGMNGANWSFSCLDVATHLAEEIPSPAKNIPKALIWTIAIGFLSGLLVIIAVLINVDYIDGGADNSGLTLFYRITNNTAAASGLWVLVLITAAGALWSIQTWQSRLAWTISREGGFPLHRYLSRLAPAPFHTPIWSINMSATLTAIFGCLYLGSDLAFTSLISTGILLQYVSYSIPVSLMLVQGRSKFEHGPFWYPKLGLLANIVMLSWSTVAVVFYCFPTYLPVVTEQMNYVSVVLVAVVIFNPKRNASSLGIRMRWGMRNGIFHVAKEEGSDEVLGVAMWLRPRPTLQPPTWNDWLEGWRLYLNQVGMNFWYGRGGLIVKVKLPRHHPNSTFLDLCFLFYADHPCAQRYFIWKDAQAKVQSELWDDPRGYYFLNIMVVSPNIQGKGIGAKLMKAVLDQADAENMKCYLESSRDVPNIAIYGRWGFKLAKEMICDDDGDAIKLFTMFREPHAEPGDGH